MRKCIKNEITRHLKIENKLLNSSNINYIYKEQEEEKINFCIWDRFLNSFTGLYIYEEWEEKKTISAFGADFKIVLQVDYINCNFYFSTHF